LRLIAPDWAGVILSPAAAGGVGTRLAMRGTAQTVNGGECQKGGAKGGEPAEFQVRRPEHPGGERRPRIEDRPAHALDRQTGLFGAGAQLSGRPEPGPAPQPRARPGAQAARGGQREKPPRLRAIPGSSRRRPHRSGVKIRA